MGRDRADAVSQGFFICHCRADTEWVRALVEYLKACSPVPPAFRCSYLPGCALNREDTEPTELKYEVMRADVVVAVVTAEALLDAQFVLELATAWAYDKWIVPVLDQSLSTADLPRSLRELHMLPVDGADSLVELGKTVCFEHVDSAGSRAALDRLLKMARKRRAEQRCDGTPTLRMEAFLDDGAAPEPSPVDEASRYASSSTVEIDSGIRLPGRRFPSAIESLNAGMALSDCYLNHRKGNGSGFVKKLDKSFGSFLDALGGSWNDIRVLADLEVFTGVTENLISTLPPARSDVGAWYDLGSCISTVLNMAGNGMPRNRRKKEVAAIEWRRSLDRFRQLASELNIRERDVDSILHMLETLMGPDSEKDYSNITRCLERIRRHALAYDPG
jgi:hypothetical protein